MKDFAAALKLPRKAMIMVKAGDPVDQTIAKIIEVFEKGDIIIDGGNSHYPGLCDADERNTFEFWTFFSFGFLLFFFFVVVFLRCFSVFFCRHATTMRRFGEARFSFRWRWCQWRRGRRAERTVDYARWSRSRLASSKLSYLFVCENTLTHLTHYGWLLLLFFFENK
jgi:hypothetical protein